MSSCRAAALCAATALLLVAPVRGAVPKRADVNVRGEGGLIELPRATLLGDGFYSFGAWFNVFHDSGRQAFRASPVSFSLGLPANLELSFSFSSLADEDPTRRAGEIQIATSVKYRLVEQLRWPVTVAAALRVENALSLPDLTPLLLVDRHIGKRLALVVAAGYRMGTDRRRRDELIVGLGAEYRLNHKGVAQLEAELDQSIAAMASGLTLRASFRWDVYKDLGICVVLAGGAVGATDVRVMIGLRYRPSGTGLADSDGDGIPDDKDACPDDPEDKDGYQDYDGCPDLNHAPAGQQGLHRGPVRMRMRIPQAPIPTWIMRRRKPSEVAP